MGVYDTYGEQAGQLKVGDVHLHHFNVGDKVSIPDGVYLTYVNVIVILDSVFVAEFEALVTKWGKRIEPYTFLERTWSDKVHEVLEQVAAG